MANGEGVQPQSSGQATTALVLGILGLLCCQLLGPFAWYIGNKELKAISAGVAPRSGEGTAKAGMILGIVATCLLGLALVWLCLTVIFGGLSILGALANAR